MTPQTPTVAVAHVASGSRRAFVLHFLEMLAVMFVGMGVFSGLTMLALAAAGSSLSEQSGSVGVMLMGINMSVPMVLWMAIRGHGAMRCVEMAASMMVPTAAAALLVLVDVLDVMAGMAIQHVVMIPAMLGVMLWRYDEYAQPHRRHA